MIVTALLVRDAKGWFEVTSTGEDRKEGFLSVGTLDRDDAERAAQFQLQTYTYQRIEITADIQPTPDVTYTPFLSFGIGDRVAMPTMNDPGNQSIETVRSITASVDDVGNVDFGLTVADPFLSYQERVEHVLAKGHDGSFVGRTQVANAPSQRNFPAGRRTAPAPVEFNDAREMGGLTTGAQTGLKGPDRVGTFRKAVLDVWPVPATPVVIDIEYPWDPSSPGSNVIATVTASATDGHGEVAGDGLPVDPGSPYGAVLTDDGGGFQTINLRLFHA